MLLHIYFVFLLATYWTFKVLLMPFLVSLLISLSEDRLKQFAPAMYFERLISSFEPWIYMYVSAIFVLKHTDVHKELVYCRNN